MKKDCQDWLTDLNRIIGRHFFKNLDEASTQELSFALSHEISNNIIPMWEKTRKTWIKKRVKMLYYFSAEFLMGRWLGNTLINLNMRGKFRHECHNNDISFNDLEDAEREPGLGNGGLGRLAACFLDSLATLDYPAMGYGIRYRYGMFEQKIERFEQKEVPDDWLTHGDAYSICRRDRSVDVPFGGHVIIKKNPQGEFIYHLEDAEIVQAIPYDVPIIGYGSNTVGTLRLWEAESSDGFNLDLFQHEEYQKAVEKQNRAEDISRVLYPNDQGILGKNLRLRQQYFFVSASLQDIIRRFKQTHGSDFSNFAQAVAIQLNDTHPVITIPELMRLFVDIEDLSWDEAWSITIKTCAYTNHTILSEAMERWPVDLMSALLPRHYQLIEEINRRFLVYLRQVYSGNYEICDRMSIISNGYVNMAFLAIVGSHSINGVAQLHTEILKNDILKDWYNVFPEKFNNKTNGVTQRRWLLKANRDLAAWITEKIGEGWITNLSLLSQIEEYQDDEQALKELDSIKMRNKVKLKEYMKKTKGIEVDPNAIFDVQVKRFHEYKRQLMNALHIIYLYQKMKRDPNFDLHPRVFIFAGKASSGYRQAKLVIKLINVLSDLINNDPVVRNRIKVVFLENYNVSLAEKIFPASDISEQISTAGYEASGTGNMKFMMNGAITLGTMDGANVEIVEAVTHKNAFIFGLNAEQVKTEQNMHNMNEFFQHHLEIRDVVDFLMGPELAKYGEQDFREIYDSLLYGTHGHRADKYMVLSDLISYIDAQEQIAAAYTDRQNWTRMCLINIARSGKFSSDRTIHEYAKEIWDLHPIKIDES